MERAADAMTFGGPVNRMKRGTPGATHMVIEPDGTEVLNGFHVETITAAASLLCVHLDDQQLMPLEIKVMARPRLADFLGVGRKDFFLRSVRLEERK